MGMLALKQALGTRDGGVDGSSAHEHGAGDAQRVSRVVSSGLGQLARTRSQLGRLGRDG